MRELLLCVTLLSALSAAAGILLPEGRFRGYARLFCGLWVILIIARTLLCADVGEDVFSPEYSPTEISAEAMERENAAKILVEEERLLSEEIWEKYGVRAGVRVREDGSILSITVAGEVSPEVKARIAAEFGVEECFSETDGEP